VKVIDEPNCLWFKLLGYDLECDSSHGDFPIAKKDLSKWIRELKTILYSKENKLNLEDIYYDCENIFERATKYFSRIFLKINIKFN